MKGEVCAGAGVRVVVAALVGFSFVSQCPAAAQGSTFKVAFYNIQSGKGEPALAGHPQPFVDTTNCTDSTQPLNAWGVGVVQDHLVSSIGSDPSIVALGLAESWASVCGSPEHVRAVLGWKARSSERNGLAMVARFGFAGPEQWQQLDTSLNTNPADTMWVLRIPVCLDAACSASIDVVTAHWFGAGTYKRTSYDRQAAQTVTFLQQSAAPHVFMGDLNVWDGSTKVCNENPTNIGLQRLRDAGYTDGWLLLHGAENGYTGMLNRAGCGTPEGTAWKRPDYAWVPSNLLPVSITRFGMVAAGDAAPSDHYGLIAEFPLPGIEATIVPPVAGPANIVLYAKNASTIAGNWQLVADPSAAGGARMWNPDAGAPKLTVPLASPASYFELTFNAEAGRGYRLWLRGRADRDYYGNDSVYVQFSDSVSATGTPENRIGTTTAAAVSIEDCSGCGLAGWGWQDNGYGGLGPPVYFATSGRQTLRVQQREDGISIDQVVLSPEEYLTVAPGTTRNDSTVLPETIVSRGEIVMRASAANTVAGAWRIVADATAAGGSAVWHPDAGAAKLTTPLASPANYIELTFDADAGRAYRLWLRGRADGDSWANDSVFVQFSGATAAAGLPVARIGTADALVVNLEEASNAGLGGWGWQDDGYGTGVLGPLVRFATAGTQTIRIQTREDGIRLDQIVLSSEKYIDAAPGALKNDTTVLK